MVGSLKWRVGVIIGLLALCVMALLPKEGPDGERLSPLNLGLDLQGGMHLAVEVDDPDQTLDRDARADAIERTLTTIRNRIDEFGVREPQIQRSGDRIIVELAGVDDPDRARAIVARTAFMEFKIITDGSALIDVLPRMDRAIVAEIGEENLQLTPLTTEVDLTDILEGATATVDSQAPDSLAADSQAADSVSTADSSASVAPASDTTPATDTIDSPISGAELRPLTAFLNQGQVAGEFLVAEQDVPTVERYLALEAVQALIPREVTLHWGTEQFAAGGTSYRSLYVLDSEPLLTGENLADAGPANRDPTFNRPLVPFETTRRGARIFERGTSRHVGDNMAIVLDGRVQSYAVIRSTLGRRAQIELAPGASFQEAQDLALVLRAGALPMPIRIVEERSVGPSLGADSIRQGRIAFIIGLSAVVLLMIGYYHMSGVLAVTAMAGYVVFVLGGLAGLGANLTLPGIAGLILSLGMAVDANVLIFERIREEIDAGKTPRTAVDAGFANALSAIVDANLTTLITGIILFQFGTGPVRGFAVTLCIGILASFFSAVYVTRTLFTIYLNRRATSESLSI
jgi:preprotein translocase subunit SecD